MNSKHTRKSSGTEQYQPDVTHPKVARALKNLDITMSNKRPLQTSKQQPPHPQPESQSQILRPSNQNGNAKQPQRQQQNQPSAQQQSIPAQPSNQKQLSKQPVKTNNTRKPDANRLSTDSNTSFNLPNYMKQTNSSKRKSVQFENPSTSDSNN